MSERLDAEVAALEVGIVREGARGRLGGDAAADHDELALGERGRDAEVLLDEEDREPLRLEELERLDEALDDRRREALRGLVHDEDPRVRDEGAADREHLLLAAGELGSTVALPLGEAREQLVDALARPFAAVRLAPRLAMRRCWSTVRDGKRRRPWGT